MKTLYFRTPKLKEARFRGQRALVVEVLSDCSSPAPVEGLAAVVDKNGRYSALLNEWAKENGGVKGSIRYHLRELRKRGMVEVTQVQEVARVQIVGCGNSQAIRIPRAMLDALHMSEGDEVELMVEDGRLTARPVNPKLTLESLVAQITPENCHEEIDWGKPVGKEVW
jgi:antitoxin MazE